MPIPIVGMTCTEYYMFSYSLNSDTSAAGVLVGLIRHHYWSYESSFLNLWKSVPRVYQQLVAKHFSYENRLEPH